MKTPYINNTNNINRLPIKSVAFDITNPRKTICCITYWNPLLQTWCHAKGVAKCHPDDTPDCVKGERIAEARAKMCMYWNYAALLDKLSNAAAAKHIKLSFREAKHVSNLINNK